MTIKMHELKKVITSLVVSSLAVLFVIMNFFLMLNHYSTRDDLSILTQYVDQFGDQTTDETIEHSRNYYDQELRKMNEISFDKTNQVYDSAASLFEEINYDYDLYEAYSSEELDALHQVWVLESYITVIDESETAYASINMLDRAESEIAKYGLSGNAAQTVRDNYLKLEDRFQQHINRNEPANMFFNGELYQMHSFLFNTIFRSIILQIMILVVLVTGFLMNYEFENKTHLVVYSSKKGKNLIWDKLLVSLGMSVIITTFIAGITLIGYFSLYSYKGLWNVPISNYFNWENGFPFLTWGNMTFKQYLLGSVSLIYICSLLFTAITFILSLFIKSSYYVFIVFGILFGLILLLPNAIPMSSNLTFLPHFTPFTLILNPANWFMGGRDIFSSYKHYELMTVGIWTISLFILGLITGKKFMKEDLH